MHTAALEVCDNPFRPLKTEIGTWAGSRCQLFGFVYREYGVPLKPQIFFKN